MKQTLIETTRARRAPIRPPAKLAASNGNGTSKPSVYGSHELSKDIVTVTDQAVRVPVVDKEYIRTTAITCGNAGEKECREHHTHIFNAANAELLAQSERSDEQLKVEIAGAGRHIHDLTKIQDQTDRYREVTERTVPWTKFDIVQVVTLAIMSALLLGVGINTNATVLQSSGIAAFESAWRAYLFSFIPVGLAVAVKVPGSHISLRSRRLVYTYLVWALGLVFGFVWAVKFASTFPGLTQTTAELIDSLTNPAAPAADAHSNSSFVLVAMLAEVFLAGGCWLTIQFITEKHAPASRTDNPPFLKTQSDLTYWHGRQAENRQLAGLLTGKICAINEARAQFVGTAMGCFRAAARLAANDQHLKNFLNR